MKIILAPDKETKNMMRFKEITTSKIKKIGLVYVPKTTLDELQWDGKKALTFDIELAEM